MANVDQLHAVGQQLAGALIASYQSMAPEAQLAFLPGGVSVPDDLVQLGVVNAAQMQTWLSMNFDSPFVVSAADAAVLMKDPSHGTASKIYTQAASFASPLGTPADPGWQRVTDEIAEAQRSLGPSDMLKQIACEPDDWPLPNASYWTKFDSSQTQATTSTQTTPVVSPAFWRVRALAATVLSPAPAPPPADSDSEVRLPGNFHDIAVTRVDLPERTVSPGFSGIAAAAPIRETPLVAPATAVVQPAAASTHVDLSMNTSPLLANWRVAADSGQLAAQVSASALFANAASVDQVTTSTSSTVTVHLEHQCVTLGYYFAGQPWWNGVFLADPGWYIPGMSRGGLLPVSEGAAAGHGYGLPISLIVVRNLEVSGQWTAEATSALSSPGGTLGPLSLFGAQAHTEADGQTVTYAHPGMQVVALLCSALPVLPPVDAPA